MLPTTSIKYLTTSELRETQRQLNDQINYCYERKLFGLVYAYEAGLMAINKQLLEAN